MAAVLSALWPALLFPGRDPYELRLFDADGVRFTAICDQPDLLAATSEAASRDGWTVYATLNPVSPELVPRHVWNQLRPVHLGGTARDRDIARRLQFFLDIEPERPSGVGTTVDQLAAARTLADMIVEDLRALGWEPLAIVCSGNGYHIRYRLDLRADDGGLIKYVLTALAHRYSNAVQGIKVDASVSNRARLARVPGTTNRKGRGGPETPHRMCEIVQLNPNAAIVSEAQLHAIAAKASKRGPAPAASKPQTQLILPSQFNLEKFIAARLPHAVGPDSYDGGRRWTLPCPWKGSDDRPAFIIERSSEDVQAGCLQADCRQSGKSWPDLYALFDERYAAQLASEQRRQGMPAAIANEWRRHGRRK